MCLGRKGKERKREGISFQIRLLQGRQEVRHYVTNFPQNNNNNKASRGAIIEALVSQFELDFTLIACMVSSVMGSMWYLESVASFHITDNKGLFSSLEEKDLEMHIKWEMT